MRVKPIQWREHGQGDGANGFIDRYMVASYKFSPDEKNPRTAGKPYEISINLFGVKHKDRQADKFMARASVQRILSCLLRDFFECTVATKQEKSSIGSASTVSAESIRSRLNAMSGTTGKRT
jgi:hypothetical protein